jgi:hypothetical protein
MIMIWFSQSQDAALTEGRGMCDIFAIGLYHWDILSNIYGLRVKEPERQTATTTWRMVFVARQPRAIL